MYVLATYSPCCKLLREGDQPPEVMHSGLCREKHGKELGDTIPLVDLRPVFALVSAVREMQNAHAMLGSKIGPPGWALDAVYSALNDFDA